MPNKKAYSGTGSVFGFTLKQLFTNKSNIAALVIMFVFAALAVPGFLLISGGDFPGSDGEELEVRLVDNTGLVSEAELADYLGDGVIFSEDSTTVFTVGNNGEEYTVDVTAAEYSDKLYEIYGSISEIVTSKESGLSPDVTKVLGKNSCFDYGVNGDGFSSVAYGVQTVTSVAVMIVTLFASTYILRTVVEEKSSRLVETLTVSVSPLALMLGKILAVLVYVAALFGVLVAGYLISYKVFGMFIDVSVISGFIENAKEILSSLSAGSLCAAVVSVILGVLAFSLISALAGAGCSTTEDMGSANGTPMIIVMACYMTSLIVGSLVSDSALRVMSVIPFLSSFVAPVQYLNGNLGTALLILSWILQAFTCAVLLYICAKVYRDLLFHNGRRITFGSAVRMAFGNNGRKEAKGE